MLLTIISMVLSIVICRIAMNRNFKNWAMAMISLFLVSYGFLTYSLIWIIDKQGVTTDTIYRSSVIYSIHNITEVRENGKFVMGVRKELDDYNEIYVFLIHKCYVDESRKTECKNVFDEIFSKDVEVKISKDILNGRLDVIQIHKRNSTFGHILLWPMSKEKTRIKRILTIPENTIFYRMGSVYSFKSM